MKKLKIGRKKIKTKQTMPPHTLKQYALAAVPSTQEVPFEVVKAIIHDKKRLSRQKLQMAAREINKPIESSSYEITRKEKLLFIEFMKKQLQRYLEIQPCVPLSLREGLIDAEYLVDKLELFSRSKENVFINDFDEESFYQPIKRIKIFLKFNSRIYYIKLNILQDEFVNMLPDDWYTKHPNPQPYGYGYGPTFLPDKYKPLEYIMKFFKNLKNNDMKILFAIPVCVDRNE